MTQLFDALRRVVDKNQGAIFVDGSKCYRHWLDPADTVNLESSGIRDVAFVDQDVRFDHQGRAQAIDVDGTAREVRILVLVPYGPTLQVIELIDPPK